MIRRADRAQGAASAHLPHKDDGIVAPTPIFDFVRERRRLAGAGSVVLDEARRGRTPVARSRSSFLVE